MKRLCRYKLIWAMVCLCALLCGCGEKVLPAGETAGTPAPAVQTASTGAETAKTPQPGGVQAEAAGPPRSNEPEVLLPQSPGTAVIGTGALEIDVSNVGQGYVTARYSGSAAKASVLITGPDGVTYKYFLPPSEEHEALPLTSGSGSYTVEGYENISGTSYAVLFKETVEVSLSDELLPFLYANLYVDFNEQSQAVAKAQEVTANAADDLEAVELIYHYVVENVSYDQQKAETVTSGYLPSVDDTLRTKKGICFDYAALTCAMLRSQRIPAKLEIGYAGQIYHAWISVYVPERGWIDRLIEFTGDGWTRMDPTFASGNGGSDEILKYIGDGDNYNLQYSR